MHPLLPAKVCLEGSFGWAGPGWFELAWWVGSCLTKQHCARWMFTHPCFLISARMSLQTFAIRTRSRRRLSPQVTGGRVVVPYPQPCQRAITMHIIQSTLCDQISRLPTVK